MMTLQEFLKELKQESTTTRKMLSRIPTDKFGWRPHAKSMSIENLTTHIAELPTWIPMVLDTRELDFANNPYQPKSVANTEALLELFEASLEEGIASLEKGSDNQLKDPWTLRNGEQVYSTDAKEAVIPDDALPGGSSPCPAGGLFKTTRCTYTRQLRPQCR